LKINVKLHKNVPRENANEHLSDHRDNIACLAADRRYHHQTFYVNYEISFVEQEMKKKRKPMTQSLPFTVVVLCAMLLLLKQFTSALHF
jgi:hypothetical protein